jgi:nitroimidazol reductase NimA-like FMN-containing flavoprotein (pyridoxamine 5'-phosphate oxidase superfamily)
MYAESVGAMACLARFLTDSLRRNLMQIIPIRRHADRAVPEEASEILRTGHVAHVGYLHGGQPTVIPLTYQYDDTAPEHMYLHGAVANATLRELATGVPVCVTVTLLDGLIYSRTATNHSVNYRSVVCYGHAHAVTDEAEKEAILARMISRYFPGRMVGEHYAAPELGHLRATGFVAVHIDAWNAKARRGGPMGPADDDADAPGTAGVVELG